MSDSSANEEEHLETLNSLLTNYNSNKKSSNKKRSKVPVIKKSISLYRKKDDQDDSNINVKLEGSSTSADESESSTSRSSDEESATSSSSNSSRSKSEQQRHQHFEEASESMEERPLYGGYQDKSQFQSQPMNPRNPQDMVLQPGSFVQVPQEEISSEPESELSIEIPDVLPTMRNPAQQQSYQQPQAKNFPVAEQPKYRQPPPDASPIPPTTSYKVIRKAVPGENYGITPLTIITFNTWYSKKDHLGRTKVLIKHLLNGDSRHLVDLICLQEVTPKSFQLIRQSLEPHYALYEVFGEPPLPYSSVIAVNRNTLEVIDNALVVYDFDSQMGRKLMVCQMKMKNAETSFYVLNTHLESLEENWKYRRVQMESIYRLIKEEKYRNFLLIGDFNIFNDQEPIETQLRLYEYLDSWIEMGSPESLKYTFDSSLNSYAQMKAPNLKFRSDRILYRFKDDKAVIAKLRLLGIKDPFPSDHFGLMAQFMIKSKN